MKNRVEQMPAVYSDADNQQLPAVFDGRFERRVEEDDELDLRLLWKKILRYKTLILSLFLLFFASALAISLLLRPMYTATALLEINANDRNLVKFQNVEESESNTAEFMVTQSNLLKSEAVSDEVITNLGLNSKPEFDGSLRQRGLLSGVKSLLGLMFSKNNKPESAAENNNTPQEIYSDRLSISPIRSSSLIKVSFTSFDAKLAADIVNQHSQSYILLNNKRRLDSTSGAKVFLEQEIENVQAKLETSEKQLTDFARKHGVIDVEDRNNIMMTRMSELNKSLAEVQNSRIDAETQFQQGQVNILNAVNPIEENVVVLQLREQQARLQADYNEQSKVFKPAYPAMVQLKAKIDELQASIERQVSREESKVQVGLESRYKQLSQHEIRLTSTIENLKQQMLNLQDRAVTYNILKREWEANKELYAGLLERTKEVGVAAGMELNVASIVDIAKPPKEASYPKIPLNLAIGSLLGLLLGLGSAFLLAMLDNTINDVDQLTALTGVPHLGVLPHPESVKAGSKEKIKTRKTSKGDNKLDLDLSVLLDPQSMYAESIQSVRTSMSFSNASGMPKSIMVTSSVPSEGKSTLSNNLAISIAKSGKRVMLLETDLRKSRFHKIFGVPAAPGLSDYLVDDNQKFTSYKVGEIDGLNICVAGTSSPNPVGLLGSEKMRLLIEDLKEKYDVVIVDCPPVIGLADSIIMSQIVDSVLFVVAAHKTPIDAVKNSLRRLKLANAPILGTVFNMVRSDLNNEDYNYYGYYGVEE